MEITGIQAATVEGNFDWPLLKIDTDEGISGIGEVRDHGRPKEGGLDVRHSETLYVGEPKELALKLEDQLVGEDPTNIIRRFEEIKPFGGWGRLGGGVSGVEMALFDIAGKHYGVPAYQLLGGSYRDEVRVYCDCRAGNPVADSGVDYDLDKNDYAPEDYARHAEQREAEGFDFLKFDLDPHALEYVTGEAGVRSGHLTKAGLDYLVDVTASIREAIDDTTDFGFDCAAMRDMPMKDTLAFARAIEEYDVAAFEDVFHDRQVSEWKELTENTTVPTITGEDLYAVEGFGELIRNEAIDLVGPDLLTAGGIRETARICDFANQHGIPANLHFAASPVGFMASVHAAAAIEDLLAVEFHAVGVPWWEDLVQEGPLFEDGYADVPERPGLGITLDMEVVEEHAKDGEEVF